jgi:HK97 family phage major capsid protein
MDEEKLTFENESALKAHIADEAKKQAMEIVEAEKKKEEEAQKKVSPPTVEVGEDNLSKDPKGGFKSLGDFAYALYTEKKNFDPRLKAWEDASKSLGVIAPESGGYLVPSEFSIALISEAIEASALLSGMRNIPMQTGMIKLPYVRGFNQSGGLVYGGIKWYWVAEGDQGTESEPKVAEFNMTLHDLMGLCTVNRNLMTDSPVSIGALLQAGFASGLNAMLNDAVIRGTGAGQPLGILNSPALITVDKESAQVADTIIPENLANMFSRIYRGNGATIKWLINQDCFPQLYLMSVAVGTGGAPIWIPGDSAAGRPNDTLLGYPVEYFDHCSTLGDLGDIILVNLSQYWLGTKAGMDSPRFESSIHLYFDYNKEAFSWNYRVDGRSPWPQAFKPPQSPKTRSPFVTLAARA